MKTAIIVACLLLGTVVLVGCASGKLDIDGYIYAEGVQP